MENRFDISEFVDVLTPQKTICDLVNRIRKRRKELKLTQKTLSKKSGVSLGSLRRFETTGEISLSSLIRIADAMDYLEDFNQLFAKRKIKSLKDL